MPGELGGEGSAREGRGRGYLLYCTACNNFVVVVVVADLQGT